MANIATRSSTSRLPVLMYWRLPRKSAHPHSVFVNYAQETHGAATELDVGPACLADRREVETIALAQEFARIFGYGVRAFGCMGPHRFGFIESAAAAAVLNIADGIGEGDLPIVLAHWSLPGAAPAIEKLSESVCATT